MEYDLVGDNPIKPITMNEAIKYYKVEDNAEGAKTEYIIDLLTGKDIY